MLPLLYSILVHEFTSFYAHFDVVWMVLICFGCVSVWLLHSVTKDILVHILEHVHVHGFSKVYVWQWNCQVMGLSSTLLNKWLSKVVVPIYNPVGCVYELPLYLILLDFLILDKPVST